MSEKTCSCGESIYRDNRFWRYEGEEWLIYAKFCSNCGDELLAGGDIRSRDEMIDIIKTATLNLIEANSHLIEFIYEKNDTYKKLIINGEIVDVKSRGIHTAYIKNKEDGFGFSYNMYSDAVYADIYKDIQSWIR